MERRLNLLSRQRFEDVRNDIACRLSAIVRDLQESELVELTSRMARLQLRYDQRTAVPGKDDCGTLMSRRSRS